MVGGNITWSDGDKHLCITPASWAKKSVPKRIAAAKEDLKRAGHVAEAGLLNKGSLNTAWQKLPDDIKRKYKAMRDEQPSEARTEHKQKRERTAERDGRREEAQGNYGVAKSLGLAGAPFGAAPEAQAEEDEAEVDRAFKVACITSDEASVDAHTYTEPMCGAVLSEAATYDNKSKDVLIVRVSSAGLECTVGEPVKVDPRMVIIPVTRTNRGDFIYQLLPESSEAKRTAQVAATEQTIKAAFGEHFDYQVLNNAFNAMVPQKESWTVEVTVNPPFLFGNLKQSIMFKAPNAVDGLALFPLEKEEPRVEEKAQVVLFDNDDDQD